GFLRALPDTAPPRSSSGPGRRPLTAETGVRFPYGAPTSSAMYQQLQCTGTAGRLSACAVQRDAIVLRPAQGDIVADRDLRPVLAVGQPDDDLLRVGDHGPHRLGPDVMAVRDLVQGWRCGTFRNVGGGWPPRPRRRRTGSARATSSFPQQRTSSRLPVLSSRTPVSVTATVSLQPTENRSRTCSSGRTWNVMPGTSVSRPPGIRLTEPRSTQSMPTW